MRSVDLDHRAGDLVHAHGRGVDGRAGNGGFGCIGDDVLAAGAERALVHRPATDESRSPTKWTTNFSPSMRSPAELQCKQAAIVG